jgi:hypothetical protein
MWALIKDCIIGLGVISASYQYGVSEKHFQQKSAQLQIRPLRFASVGKTKGTLVFSVEVDRRSLGFAPPDFLWNLVALVDFMRLSLTERRTRGLVQCCVAGNPGRDDKGECGALREDRIERQWNSRSLHFATLRSG